MDLFTWQTRGSSSVNGQEVRSYVLAGHLYGIVVDATGGPRGPFIVGNINDEETVEEARAMALWQTQMDERNGFTVDPPAAAHFAGYDLNQWWDADYAATDASEIAEFLVRTRRGILERAGVTGVGDVPKVDPMVTVVPGSGVLFSPVGVKGPPGPPSEMSVGSLWIDADDQPPIYYTTTPAGGGLATPMERKSFTIEMNICDVDPEVLKILTGDADFGARSDLA